MQVSFVSQSNWGLSETFFGRHALKRISQTWVIFGIAKNAGKSFLQYNNIFQTEKINFFTFAYL